MSKIRNTPHVYTRSVKHLGIHWYPGNAEGFSTRRPMTTQVERDRIRASMPHA